MKLGISFLSDVAEYANMAPILRPEMLRLTVSWKYREPEKGKYDFRALFARIDELVRLGIHPYLTIELNNPQFTRPETHGITNQTPTDWSQAGDFIDAVVDLCAPKGVQHFEILNESESPNNGAGGAMFSADKALDMVAHLVEACNRNSEYGCTPCLGGMASDALDVLVIMQGLADYEIKYIARKPVGQVRTISKEEILSKAYKSRFDSFVKPLHHGADGALRNLHLYGPPQRDDVRFEAYRNMVAKAGALIGVSEFGVDNLAYVPDQSPDYMKLAFYQRVVTMIKQNCWYGLFYTYAETPSSTPGNNHSHLVYSDRGLTPIGEAFSEFAR